MRVLVAVALLALLSVSLAGCAKDPVRHPGGVSSSTSHSATHSATASNSTAPVNHAPTGSITAVVNGTTARFTLNATDADGDALNWTLTYGDGNATNGTILPAAGSHNYTKAGNYTANFTVLDAKGGNATFNTTVHITGSSGGSGGAANQQTEGSWTVGGPISCAQFGFGTQDPYDDTLEGVEWVKFDINPATMGKPFTAVGASTGAYGFYELQFYDAGGAAGDYFDDDGNGNIAGTVPSGAAFAVFYPCASSPGSFTYTVV